MPEPFDLAGDALRAYVHRKMTVIEHSGGERMKWDLEGRPVSARLGDVYYRRGISDTMMARGRWERAGRIVPEEERRRIADRFARLAREGAVAAARREGAPSAALRARLATILAWDEGQRAGEAGRFLEVYRPVPVLPPDRELSFVVQLTEGCSWNRCSFCGLYPDRRFAARRPEAVEEHTRRALRFFGRSILLRSGIFLGDGDPFVLSDGRLLPLVDRVRRVLREWEEAGAPLPASLDLYAFARVSSLARRSGTMKEYAARRFRRLYFGVESGDAALFGLLRKPGSLSMVGEAVRRAKESGIAVGLIFLAGVGGQRHREAHREGTIRLVASLPLDEKDILFLSPFRLVEGTAYARWSAREGIEPLTREEMHGEAQEIVLQVRAAGCRAKAAYYPLEHFVY